MFTLQGKEPPCIQRSQKFLDYHYVTQHSSMSQMWYRAALDVIMCYVFPDIVALSVFTPARAAQPLQLLCVWAP